MRVRSIVSIVAVALAASACATRPASYAYQKEGSSKDQTAASTSECQYQIRLNKTPANEQSELMKLCMQGKGYRLQRVPG
jgi:hypothetical protein